MKFSPGLLLGGALPGGGGWGARGAEGGRGRGKDGEGVGGGGAREDSGVPAGVREDWVKTPKLLNIFYFLSQKAKRIFVLFTNKPLLILLPCLD